MKSSFMRNAINMVFSPALIDSAYQDGPPKFEGMTS